MSELSLNRYINQKLTYLFIVLIIIVIITVFFIIESFIENIVYDYMYNLTLDSVFSSLDQFSENINIQEKSYDKILINLTNDFKDKLSLENVPLIELDDNMYTAILQETLAANESNMRFMGIGNGVYTNTYFYIIKNNGEIVKTNDIEQLNLTINDYPNISRGLERNTLLQRYINNDDNLESRKYAYLRYSNDYIIKISFPLHINLYDKITQRFLAMKEKFSFLKSIAVFRDGYIPINNVFSLPTENDLLYFNQLSKGNNLIKNTINNYSFDYYTVWYNEIDGGNYLSTQPYYIKLTMDFSDNILSISRTITFIICLILFLAIFSVYLINRQVSKKITTPFVELAENMNRLGTHSDLTNIDERLERTDIKEVNMLLASYQEMTSELSSSFEELRAVNEELEDSYRETSVLAENLHNVIQVATRLTDTVFDDKERFLVELFYVAKKLIPEADYGTVFVVDNGEMKWLEAIGHDMEEFVNLDLEGDFYSAYDEVIYIKDIDKEMKRHNLSEAQKELIRNKRPIKSSLTVKLYVGDDLAGGLNYDIASDSGVGFSNQSIETIKAFGNLASAFLTMQSYKHIHERFQRQIILAIINMLEIHDSYTRGHSENVARISAMLAREMGYDAAEVKNIEWAGLVHDIGKILISKKILNKEGVLTADEYTQIKKHTIWGYEVLVSSDELKEIAVYIRHHHERWDGMGYPDELQAREIPRVSRIIGLADSWDTMRSDRIYRKRLTKEVAIEELKVNRGTQFDPGVVDVALRLIEEGKLQ